MLSTEILDGATILNFIKDEEAFTFAVRRRFAELDTDNDGLLRYDEMLKELQSLRVIESDDTGTVLKNDPAKDDEVYRSLFSQFDHDSDGAVSLAEYTAETKKMMVAIADGLGFSPVQMILEDDSFLKRAVERKHSSTV
ncbi:hypothetical protein L484_020067 [Morus notabilis]|uniref:EF-hand domain-containing protein n=1 Tax=Morus notabilis TaxID=981085 RepID=W9S023_9ROSA|nr:uncharacterized protein LOC21402979 [Morus notabilis]EXB80813.1 hypothetical protein L484_020067 [Morus notabilis]